MHLTTDSVFQAICLNHPCEIRRGDGSVESADLVTISPRSARVRLMSPDAAIPGFGARVELRPRFVGTDPQTQGIPARVDDVRQGVLLLRFSRPLPLTGHRLVELTLR
ncbi:MAG: hypothetical protein AB7D57_01655 [Desulfovibrionaceae bacterium]